ncbi:MAG: helicase-exonuclease AddAB subunit AddB [Hungatella sp.]|nr:helicase-exonuclease AddAB subunit AddB [Hungatella sp.]
MSLQFIIGSSGAGKTQYLYENLIRLSAEQPDIQYVAVVPEQFTMQTQKEIVTLHPDHGTMNIDIVSFERLAYRVFEELAVEHLEVLDDMGKSMVLRKVVSEQKKNLGIFSGHLNQTGFINQLKSMLSELYQYGIGPDNLRGAMEETRNPLLREKLRDLTVICQAFQEEISKRYITAEEILEVLCRVLPDSKWIKNSVVTLDGYTGFTPVQYRLLELLMVHSRKVVVTVTADPGEDPYKPGKIQNLFHMSRQMVYRLQRLAERGNVRRDRDVVLGEEAGGRFAHSPSIAFIEKHLYRFPTASFSEKPGEIELFYAATPGQEMDGVAARIHRLIQKEGIRYREIAVITGDLSGYGYEIANRFQAEKIPYFMDNKKSILENVMVEFIRGALEIIRKDFDYESVFRFLKTGLVSDEQEKIDRLENYVVAMGIRGYKRWSQNWEGVCRGGKDLNLKEMNEFRQKILSKLENLKRAMGDPERTVRTMTAAVVACLGDCEVESRLEAYREYFEQIGEYSLAKEYQQVYELVIRMFDRLVHLLGEEKMSLKEYAQILDAGFGEITVGVIPATVDRVVVGDLTRTRLDQIKVLFFVGVNEGIVPARKEAGGILTDTEREFLKEMSMELAPTAREDSFRQRFYLYLMMTKPSFRLVISWSSFSQAGKSQRPSPLIGELKKMFPRLRVRDMGEEESALSSPAEGLERLIEGLRDYENSRKDPGFWELYRYFAGHEDYREQVKKLTQAATYTYEERGISRAAARALYGTVLQGSVTRLEQYASCAYAHFLTYGLELMERQEYQIGAVDMGNLFHSSIDLCFRRLEESRTNLTGLSEEERKSLVRSCVAEVTGEYGNTILKSTARNQYLAARIERMTDRTMWALGEQLKKGDFVPAGFEVSFSAIDNLKAMKIRLSEEEEVHLRGRIDRLDLCEDERHVYVKIIDYKSGGTRFDLAAVYYGLQLQLVVYMDAVTELEKRRFPHKEVVPAGIFYYNIKDPVVEREDLDEEEDIDRLILEQLRMNGLVNSDLEVIGHMDREIRSKSDVIPVSVKDGLLEEHRSSVASGRHFEALKLYVRDKVREDGREILSGNVAARPYKQGNRTACDYCPYHGVCGFDQKIPGYRFRRFPAMKPQQVWEEILEGGEDDEVDTEPERRD